MSWAHLRRGSRNIHASSRKGEQKGQVEVGGVGGGEGEEARTVPCPGRRAHWSSAPVRRSGQMLWRGLARDGARGRADPTLSKTSAAANPEMQMQQQRNEHL